MRRLLRAVKITAIALAAVALGGLALLAWLWQDRTAPADLPVATAIGAADTADRVTATWLGITTLLFDDGETQILTDGTISRYPLAKLLLGWPLESDFAAINRALDEYRVDHLRAIVPLHSHFDHVIDAGHVANRTGAMVLGSESSANVARGSDVPVDQYQTLQYNESRYFGQFTLTLRPSRHVALLPGGSHLHAGVIDAPLSQPAPASAYRTGETYTLRIEHPAGTSLVQGSAGFVEGQLAGVRADVVWLSVAGVAGLGRDYARSYWDELVTGTGARRVYLVHFDDFTRPFGEVALFPDVVDDVASAAAWFAEFAAAAEPPVEVRVPPFGEPLVLYE